MREWKEYKLSKMIAGIQLHVLVVATCYREAASLLDTTIYQVRTYGYCYKPKTKECINNKMAVFGIYNSGELITYDKTNRNRIMLLRDWEAYIRDYNEEKYNKLKFKN